MLVRVTDVRVQRDRGRHADLFECQSALEPAREVVTGGQLLQQPGWARPAHWVVSIPERSLRHLAENWSSPDTPAFDAIPARRALSTAMPWRLILRTAVNWHGEKEGEPLAYVGESEDIGSHIKSHDPAKDWGAWQCSSPPPTTS